MGRARRLDDSGTILVEYGMILVVVVLVSFALIQVIGGQVVQMFQGVLDFLG